MKICDSFSSCRSLSQRWTEGTSFPIYTTLYTSNWTMWIIGISRKIDVRKWCPFTRLEWWRRSNSGNVGPVWKYISISSDSTNNSSDSFIRINFLRLKRYAPSSQCVPLGFEAISQFTNLTPPTIEDMWCETPKALIGNRLSPCDQAHGLNFAL
jgi:hypothetical protein